MRTELAGSNAAAEVAEDDVRNHVVVRVADEVVVDLMGRACGVGYAEAAGDAETFERNGVAIPIAIPATLLRLKDEGKTMLVATHDMHLVEETADRIIVLGESGDMIREGLPADILGDSGFLAGHNLIHEHGHYHARERHGHPHLHGHQDEGHPHSHG